MGQDNSNHLAFKEEQWNKTSSNPFFDVVRNKQNSI